MGMDTLLTEVQMKAVHAKILMRRIDEFRREQSVFASWLTQKGVAEYREVFAQNGVLTFASFYYLVPRRADLVRVLGQRNTFDVDLIWRECPKIKRQNNNGGGDGDEGVTGSGKLELPHHRSGLSNGSVCSQIEGKL